MFVEGDSFPLENLKEKKEEKGVARISGCTVVGGGGKGRK